MEVTISERTVASVLMGTSVALGLCATVYFMFITLFDPKKLSSFNAVCISKCFLNLIALSGYAFLQLPMTITGHQTTSLWTNNVISIIMANCYTYVLFLNLILSINRVIAIYFWSSYCKLCGPKPTWGLIFVAFLFHIGWFMYFKNNDCTGFFNGSTMKWDQVGTECDHGISHAFYLTFIVTVCAEALNALTFIKICVFFYGGKYRANGGDKTTKRNAWLYVQTVLQDCLFIGDMIMMTKLDSLSDHVMWQFLTRTLSGILVHVLDSVILLVFQHDFRRPVIKIKIHWISGSA